MSLPLLSESFPLSFPLVPVFMKKEDGFLQNPVGTMVLPDLYNVPVPKSEIPPHEDERPDLGALDNKRPELLAKSQGSLYYMLKNKIQQSKHIILNYKLIPAAFIAIPLIWYITNQCFNESVHSVNS